MPSWAWYVIGAAFFVVIFLYIRSSKNIPTESVPSTNDLQTYNGLTDIFTQILQNQNTEMSQLNNHPYVNKTVG